MPDETEADTVAPAPLPPPEAAKPATIFPQQLGRFELLEKLGEGGMGTVYRARHVALGREVALKLLPPHVASDPGTRERFLREAKAAASVSHPNVVTVYEAGEEVGRLYMALELVPGGDAEKLLAASGGRLSERRALEVVRDACRGLAALEKAGLVHRDVKPSNVFIGASGEAKLADLGLARSQGGDDRLTQTGIVVGTPAFMSPEQANGESDIDVRTDVYALGATLFELVTGRRPYEGPSPLAVVAQVLKDPVPDPLVHNPDLSEATARAILRAMSKERDRRYRTAFEMLEALEKALALLGGGSGAPAGPVSRKRTVPTTAIASSKRVPAAPPARSSLAPWVAVLGTLGLVAAAAIGIARWRRLHAPPPRKPGWSGPQSPGTSSPGDLRVVPAPGVEAVVEQRGSSFVVKPLDAPWSRAAIFDDSRRPFPRKVKWELSDVELISDGNDPALEKEHGFPHGAAFFYELGIDSGTDHDPVAAAQLEGALWVSLHLRKSGEHLALLRAKAPGRGSMAPGGGLVTVLAEHSFAWDRRAPLQVWLAANEAGWGLKVVAPLREFPLSGGWREATAARDALRRGSRIWTHLGNWGGAGRGRGTVTVLDER